MQVIADLQLHSKFSRAVSKEMTIPNIASWAGRKGIGLVATGDWTHPLWMREIQATLEETGTGLLRLRHAKVARTPGGLPGHEDPLFLLATEVSCIYSQGGKVRRIHILVWVPTLASALKISQQMTRRGCNLLSDGRPIIGLTAIELAQLVLSVEPKALVIPSHAWTPWFSVYGGMSGFDSLDEAFGSLAKDIYAVETGLSSSPSMNWRIKELDHRSIVSFSDAHSGPKLGREATVFEAGELSFESIRQAIMHKEKKTEDKTLKADKKNPSSALRLPPPSSIAYTIEFHPEEGKYHFAGHRSCNIRWGPQESKAKGTTCPVCGKPLTQGVVQRVEELAGRTEEDLQLETAEANPRYGFSEGVVATRSKAFPKRPPFVMLVPLTEIIAESIGSPVTSPKVQSPYFQLTDAAGGEFPALLKTKTSDIAKLAGERIAAAIDKVRRGNIVIDPGYDGVFGVVRIWKEGEEKPLLDASKEQLAMF